MSYKIVKRLDDIHSKTHLMTPDEQIFAGVQLFDGPDQQNSNPVIPWG
jgi:hypothetical protein